MVLDFRPGCSLSKNGARFALGGCFHWLCFAGRGLIGAENRWSNRGVWRYVLPAKCRSRRAFLIPSQRYSDRRIHSLQSAAAVWSSDCHAIRLARPSCLRAATREPICCINPLWRPNYGIHAAPVGVAFFRSEPVGVFPNGMKVKPGL